MEYNEVIQAISTVGFPIVCCCALFWMINTTIKELKEVIIGLTQTVSLCNARMEHDDEL